MSIAVYRIDDRLIHGQVVVGWGKPLNVGFIVLVDDTVWASPWEQDLYRMGVPPEIEVVFASTAEAAARLPEWERDPRVGILLAGDIETLAALSTNSHRSEEHTSELQSRLHLVCRLLLEKKKKQHNNDDL